MQKSVLFKGMTVLVLVLFVVVFGFGQKFVALMNGGERVAETSSTSSDVARVAKGPKGVRSEGLPNCKVIGYEMAQVSQGTNVLHSVETDSDLEKHRLGRTLKDGHRDEYRAGDKFEWTVNGRDWVFIYDGEHWRDADGDIADHEEIPFGLIDRAILTRVSPDTTRIALTAAYREL